MNTKIQTNLKDLKNNNNNNFPGLYAYHVPERLIVYISTT